MNNLTHAGNGKNHVRVKKTHLGKTQVSLSPEVPVSL